RHHGLGREVDGLLGGAALAVDGGARNVFGQARGQPGGAGDVGRLRAELVDAAEDDVVDLAGVDAGALDRGLDDVPGEVGRVDLAQTALPAPHGGADSADDVCLCHCSLVSGDGGHGDDRAADRPPVGEE